MATESDDIQSFVNQRYKHGFVTDIETESLPPGLNEDVIRAISARKKEPEFMLEWRLRAYRQWLEMREPEWAHVDYEPIDYNEISYFAAPKSDDDRPKSLVIRSAFEISRCSATSARIPERVPTLRLRRRGTVTWWTPFLDVVSRTRLPERRVGA